MFTVIKVIIGNQQPQPNKNFNWYIGHQARHVYTGWNRIHEHSVIRESIERILRQMFPKSNMHKTTVVPKKLCFIFGLCFIPTSKTVIWFEV